MTDGPVAAATAYKAVRLDGTDFHTGTVQWAPPEGHEGEWIVRHPAAEEVGRCASEHLSVSTVATDCTGMAWPCRLLTVEAVGDVTTPSPTTLLHKRAGIAFRVTGELPAHEALGPQGEHVASLIERERHLTPDEARTLAAMRGDSVEQVAARYAMRAAAWDAVKDASEDAARAAARMAVWGVAGDAAGALVVRDLIAADQYDILTRTWASAIGKVHPDDPELPSDRSTA